MELTELKEKGEAPEWMTEEAFTTLKKGYLWGKETPKDMYKRVAKAGARGDDFLEKKLFDFMFNKCWICPATPVLTNLGTDRGLPISCFGLEVQDEISSIIGEGLGELSAMTKNGGGVGVSFSKVRPRGSLIGNGDRGSSEGIIPFIKTYDSTVLAVNQKIRRGAASINLDIEHGDFYEFLKMRRPEGDINRQCGNLHHCVQISDSFMTKVRDGDYEARGKWAALMKSRMETGEPYIMWTDTVNNAAPEGCPEVTMTNICSEITLPVSKSESFVCCLSSLNLTKFDEWKDGDVVHTMMLFLNNVLDEFIDKGAAIDGLQKAVNSAYENRDVGIGVIGWHTLLQNRMIPFDSFKAMQLNNEVFKTIHDKSRLAKIALGNRHAIAIAPTRSNSLIAGGHSAGIEPLSGNVVSDRTAKGTFFIKNKVLEDLLEEKGKNTRDVWKSIDLNKGSVQHLDFLSPDEKAVFKTSYEIDQKVVVQQAAQRQKYICQSQSLNLFFNKDVSPKYFNEVHLLAHELGVKTLYYLKSEAGIGVTNASEECVACEG